MWLIVHAFSGVALGAFAPLGTFTTIVCALVLHLLLDMVPHWDYTQQKNRLTWAIVDAALSVLAVTALTFLLGLPGRALLAGVVSALPDLDVFDAVVPGHARRRLFPSHWKKFPHGRSRPWIGVTVQGAVAVGSLAAVLVHWT